MVEMNDWHARPTTVPDFDCFNASLAAFLLSDLLDAQLKCGFFSGAPWSLLVGDVLVTAAAATVAVDSCSLFSRISLD